MRSTCGARGSWLLALAALGCVGSPFGPRPLEVETAFDPQRRFDSVRSWDWLAAPIPTGDVGARPAPVVDQRVRRAVAEELVARGLPRDPRAPDVWVHAMAAVEDVVAVEARDYYATTPPWMREALRGTHVIEGQRGVLVVDLIDPASRRLVWRGVVSGAVDPAASPARRERRLHEAVRRLLGRFPPR